MELVERYLYEVGRHLPRKNRKDIVGEMRSALADTLDDKAGPNPTQEQVKEVLLAFGEPKKVAATYYPEGQYLVGPTLFPSFQMVVGIVLAAIIGAQIVAWLALTFLAGERPDPLVTLSNIVNSLPAALGWVVLVFYILQRLDVHPEEGDKPWQPEDLPEIDEKAEVSRAELIFGIVIQSILLSYVAFFSDKIGIINSPGVTFFANPVIGRFVPWLSLALLAGIGLDVYLLWQGRWSTIPRGVKLAMNAFSIVLLWLLSAAHMTWLRAHGAGTFITSIQNIAENIESGGEILSVQAFWMAFTVALIVTIIETVVMLFKMLKMQVAK